MGRKKKSRGLILARTKAEMWKTIRADGFAYCRVRGCGKHGVLAIDGKRVEVNCPTHGRIAIYDSGVRRI